MHSWGLVGVGLVAAFTLTTAVPTSRVAAADASLRIEPATVGVVSGGSFSVDVVQDAPLAISGAQASIDFDPRILQVVSVTPGSAYAKAPVLLPQDMDADIRTANATGHLAQVAAALTPPNAVRPGAATFLVVRFRAVACGQSDIRLPKEGPFNAQMISGQPDEYGRDVPVATASGHVTSCVGSDAVTANAASPAIGGTTPAGLPVEIIGAAVLLAAGLLGGLAWRSRRPKRHHDVAW